MNNSRTEIRFQKARMDIKRVHVGDNSNVMALLSEKNHFENDPELNPLIKGTSLLPTGLCCITYVA